MNGLIKYRNLFLILFITLLAGLLWSRALLSIMHVCIALLLIVANQNFKSVLQNPFITWSFIPIVLFFFGVVPDPFNPMQYDYLLTLFMYPIAALSIHRFIQYKEERITIVWLIAGAVSLVYPISWYMMHAGQVNMGYGHGKSLPTFMEGDHIRYGIFLNCLLLLATTVTCIKPILKKSIVIVLMLIIVFMAVRTAWIGLFIILIVGAFWPRFNFQKLFRVVLFTSVPVIIMAYMFIPTVRQKVNYTVYDYQQYHINGNHENFSDGTRRSINEAAWQSLTTNKTGGSGWAAIPTNLQESYSKRFPGVPLRFQSPFNQWLYWWMGGGFISMLLFTLWLLWPIWYGIKKNHPLLIAWSLLVAASCMVESTLSFQYGVFLHAWPIAMFWRNHFNSLATSNVSSSNAEPATN